MTLKIPHDYVKYIRNIGQITISREPMRSYEEVEIANYLFINGIKFEYEKDYAGVNIYIIAILQTFL